MFRWLYLVGVHWPYTLTSQDQLRPSWSAKKKKIKILLKPAMTRRETRCNKTVHSTYAGFSREMNYVIQTACRVKNTHELSLTSNKI